MIVKELIAKLQGCDPAAVVLNIDDESHCGPLTEVVIGVTYRDANGRCDDQPTCGIPSTVVPAVYLQ
jgi:hypothetical protein